MSQSAMVIDLRRCAGCGACAIACKSENNTPVRRKGQTFNWADYYIETGGTFPDVDVTFLPVQCNHCGDAPCITMCPVNPKALYKNAEGVTLRDDSRCIGCLICQSACPYSARDVDADGVQYSVNSFNERGADVHPFWNDRTEVIPGCTASGRQVVQRIGSTPPHLNDYTNAPHNSVRESGIVEKCSFCYHRTSVGEQPWCVESCPAGARIFGDITDPSSEVGSLIAQNPVKRLKNNKGEFYDPGEAGVQPHVYYINEFQTK